MGLELFALGLAIGLLITGAALAVVLLWMQRAESNQAEILKRLKLLEEAGKRSNVVSPCAEEQTARSERPSLFKTEQQVLADNPVPSRPVETAAPAPCVAAPSPVNPFNKLAASFSQANLDAFKQEWTPTAVRVHSDGHFTSDENGELWVIRNAGSGRSFILVPGEEIIRKWEMFYRTMGSVVARNLLEPYYDLKDDTPLRLSEPAVVNEENGMFRVIKRGRFVDA